jgi:TM2 domain-containing membrane protein YozV
VSGQGTGGVRGIGTAVTAPAARTPAIALALSLFYTGLGQLYNGQLKRGILIFYAAFLGFLLVTPGIVLFCYAAWDAWRTAARADPRPPPTRAELFLFFAATLAGPCLLAAAAMLYAARILL